VHLHCNATTFMQAKTSNSVAGLSVCLCIVFVFGLPAFQKKKKIPLGLKFYRLEFR